jgi:peptidoglycan hydrolase-like protein with peptidoglycan-binding domain
MMILAAALMLAGGSLAQVAPPAAKPAANPAHTAPRKPAAAPASSPESRSAAALALSHEPTFDEGTAQRIKEAALSYSDIAVRGGWPTTPSDAKFTLGLAGPNDELLRKRLIITGDLAADKATGAFDADVAEAVKRFQVRHGLAPSGTVTPRMLAAMNVPVQKRIKQLEASLERLENMNFAFGHRYVVVNIPATFAEAVEDDHVVRRYRVIVGKTEKPSPTLTAEITGVVLNPTWTVPSSIAKTEISAHMRKDPGYLARMHMEVLDAHDHPIDPHSVDWSGAHTPNFTVRQENGTFNALGAVKIDNAQCLFGLHARHQPAQPVQRRLPLRLPWLLARRQCSRPRRLVVVGGDAEMESRRGRYRDRSRAASGGRSAKEGAGGLDLSHGVDDPRPDRAVPPRRLRAGRAAAGSDGGRSLILQPGRQSSIDGAYGAVIDTAP